MKIVMLVLSALLGISVRTFSQSFGPEKKVSITGLTSDAMEPFISLDGNELFFNSLNSGGNTNLYRATKVNDSTFTFSGSVTGTYDPSSDHLDGVPSIDVLNNFFWVSLRNFPNLHRGKYFNGSVTEITRTFGDFNIDTPGWIIMDAAINYAGDQLYYCNAYFGPTFSECGVLPCEARLGVAQRLNDSTFNKLQSTESLFSNVNNSNYIVYAPQVTQDGLELYFTRILKNTVNSEICVASRNVVTEPFGLPNIIHSNLGFVPEAASPTADNQRIYYHQKDATGKFKIYFRLRFLVTDINEEESEDFKLYPNPVKNLFTVEGRDGNEPLFVVVYSSSGQKITTASNTRTIDLSDLPEGLYHINISQRGKIWTTKVRKE